MSDGSLESYYNYIHSLKIWRQVENYFKSYGSKKPLLFSMEGLGSSQLQNSISFDSQVQIQLTSTIWKGLITRYQMPKFQFQKFDAQWATTSRNSAWNPPHIYTPHSTHTLSSYTLFFLL
jgi:hypothetical protein